VLNIKESFAAGFYSVQVGVYFHVVDIYAVYCEHPSPAVRNFIQTQIMMLKDSYGPQFKHYVLRVQELTKRAGFEPPSPPQIPTEYFDWANEVTREFSARLAPTGPEDVAHNIGYHAGQVLCTWNVLMATLMLLLKDPSSEDFHSLAGRLRDDIAQSREELLNHVSEPAALQIFQPLAIRLSKHVEALLALDFHVSDTRELVICVKGIQLRMLELLDSVNQTLAILENPDAMMHYDA
jgi:hypothetical protein